MPARKPKPGLIRARVEPPGFLCAYCDQGDALNLVDALRTYGIRAEIRENWRGPYIDKDNPRFSYKAYITSYSIWVCNGAELEKANAYKQGMLAALTMKGDAGAFADGLLTGAHMRNPRRKLPMVSDGRLRLSLTSGSAIARK